MVFASEPSGPGIYFVRRAFIKNLISLGDIGLFIFSISPVSLAKFFLQGIIHFIKDVECVKTVGCNRQKSQSYHLKWDFEEKKGLKQTRRGV